MKCYILEAEENHHLLQLLQVFRLSGTKIPHTLGEQNKKYQSNEIFCRTMPHYTIPDCNYYHDFI